MHTPHLWVVPVHRLGLHSYSAMRKEMPTSGITRAEAVMNATHTQDRNEPSAGLGQRILNLAEKRPVVGVPLVVPGQVERTSVDLDVLPGQELAGTFPTRAEVALYEPVEIPDWARWTFADRVKHYTIEDPTWLILSVLVLGPLAIVGTITYGVIQMVMYIFNNSAAFIAGVVASGILILLLGSFAIRVSGVKCPGLHCGGCKG
jgi:hypothetical protein